MRIKTIDIEGKEQGEREAFANLKPENISRDLLKQAAVTAAGNARINIAHTKDRSERRGGGKKPWRQKGTGRARAGSSRSPIWRKGGVTFGPRSDKDFTARLPLSMRKRALKDSLAGKARDNEVAILSGELNFGGKTKEMAAFREKTGLRGAVLFLIADPEKRALASRAGRNVPDLFVADPANINAADVINCAHIVIAEEALGILEKRTA